MASENASLAGLAKEALRLGHPERALAILERAASSQSSDATALHALASIAVGLRQDEIAAKLFEAAIAAVSSQAEQAPASWYRSLGEACAAAGRLEAASRALRTALERAPEDADTWRWLGRVLRRIDDLPAALEACQRAVDLAPDDWSARGDLALVLFDAGALDDSAAHFDAALARAGDVPPLVVGRAKLDLQRGHRAQAIASLESCLERHPKNVGALATLALALRDEQRFDAAIGALSRAIEQSPSDAALWCGLGRTLLEAGRSGEALRLADAFLKGRPGHAGALSVKALALLALGDEAAASRLLDYDRWVTRRRLPVPDGFADLRSFNVALATAAASHPTLHRAPLRHATAAGLHSGSLMIAPAGPLLALQQTIRLVTDEYRTQLPAWPDHPHVSAQPKSTTLEMWCVVMQSGAHQVPHVHPDAWLSGVYYPQVPEAVSLGAGPGGWLAFGEPDRRFPGRERGQRFTLRPEEGLLVLFPSYFFHHTIPFEAEGTRISVAFDLVPKI